jgi:uncharacterized repeat protein (TIGR01451 family)
LAFLLTALLLVGAGSARANTFTVTAANPGDSGTGSLREAINLAQANPGADTIAFDPGLSGATISIFSAALPAMTTQIDIVGPSGGVTVSATDTYRVFSVASGGDVSMSNLTVTHGKAPPNAGGGGILNSGQLTLDQVTVSTNTSSAAVAVGGGIYNNFGGTLNVTNSEITGNQSEGTSTGIGGGIENNGTATLDHTTVSQNTMLVNQGAGTVYGGGIFIGAAGSMAITDSTITNNTALVGLGSSSASVQGGGIFSTGALSLDRVTVDDNSAYAQTPGSSASAIGGGLALDPNGGPVTVSSSTITANTASASQATALTEIGGGIGTAPGGSPAAVSLTGSTVDANNVSRAASVGANIGGNEDLTTQSTIFAGTGHASCEGLNSVTTLGYNLDQGATCTPSPAATDLQSVNPALGSLANNGGPTKTQAIAATSPATDKGIATGSTTDQRGDPRPTDLPDVTNASGGGGTDIGAYEFQPTADLSVTQTDSPDPAIDGGQITYTLDVHNGGPDSAGASTLTDTLPAGTTFVSAPVGCNHVSGVVTCALGTVVSGATPQVQIVVRATSSGTPSNAGTVSTTTPDSNSANDSSSEQTTINPGADLSVTQSDSPDPVVTGNQITYTVTVHNGGPDSAAASSMADTIPAGTTFVSASVGCNETGGVVTCPVAALTSGSSDSAFSITVEAVTAGTPTNDVAVTPDTPADPDLTNNSASETTTINNPPSTDLSVAQSDSPDPAYLGGQITYTTTVTNNGPDSAPDAQLVDTIPAGTSFVSASSGCNNVSGTVTCDLNTILNGATPQVQVTVSADATGTPSNEVTASTSITDSDSSNDSSTEGTLIDPSADLSITASDSPDPVAVGAAVTYSLTAHNAGPSTALSVGVTDTLPASLVFTSGSLGCSAAGQVVSCDLGGLAPSASRTVHVTATAESAGSVTNPASVQSSIHDPVASNNSTTQATTINVVTPFVPPPPSPGGGSAQPTGQRSAALKKCKKRRGKAHKKCVAKARKLPL